jgi:hypothetical protein
MIHNYSGNYGRLRDNAENEVDDSGDRNPDGERRVGTGQASSYT